MLKQLSSFYRTSALLLAFLTAVSLFPAVVFAAGAMTHGIDAVNSARGTDCMVVYDTGGTTGTNEWGYEISVDAEGIVVSAGGNNTEIPAGGFVVSGHGTSASWLKSYVRKGMYCFFNPYGKTVAFSRDPIDPSYSYEVLLTGWNATRVTDALILYDGSWGATTRTNEWGYEVAVSSEGRVISMGGNANAIPAGGYVLSAHGDSMKILKNLCYDEKVVSDRNKMTVTFTYDGRCAFSQSSRTFHKEADALATARDSGRMADYESARLIIAEGDSLISETDLTDSAGCFAAADKLEKLTSSLRVALSESVAGEYRGIWVRPKETTRAEVASRVESLKNAGINMISLETLYGTGVIFPVPDGCPYEQLSTFNGFDVLKAYIEECHSRQMELHLWFPNMYCGNYADRGLPKNHPDWLVKNNLGGTTVDTEYGDMYFIDPFCEEATDALLDMYRHVLTTYDVDAFQLDYIRYPGYSSVDWGYNDRTVRAFRKAYGVTPAFDPKASYWTTWCAFRADQVTEFVRSVRKLIDRVSPGTLLSADVGANYSTAPLTIYQDYPQWLEEGLLDLVHPMAYGETANFRKWVSGVVSVSRGIPVVPGTGIFENGLQANDMLDQVQAARELGCIGVVHFQADEYLSKRCAMLLLPSAYRADAFVPGKDTVRACENAIDVLLRRAQSNAGNGKALTESDCAKLKDAAETVKSRLSAPSPDCAELESALKAVSDAHLKNAKSLVSSLSSDLARLKSLMTLLRPVDETYLTVRSGMKVSGLMLQESAGAIYLRSGFEASENARAATGMYFEKNGKRVAIVVKGDISGDGTVNSSDYLRCKRAVLKTAVLTGASAQAAKVTGKQNISAGDYLIIKKHVLKLYVIE